MSDSSMNYNSSLNWTFSSPNMVQTVQQTLLCSQLACNEMQASAWTCGRQHDRKCRLKTSQYTLIVPHRVIQLTTISFWVPETRLRQQINKFPPKRVKNPATPSSIFIFISSSSTGELCSQPIRGNVHQIGWRFPEHVERSFLDPEYSFVTVQQILPTRFAKQKFAQLRTK